MKSILKSLLKNFKPEETEFPLLEELQNQINYTFKNKNILIAAMTHTSLTTPNRKATPFERMEFLGDAILGLVISEALFLKFPDFDEGQLSKIKSKIVSKKFLKMRAKEINLGKSIILSIEAENSGGRDSTSILGDTMESLICAIYMDGGIKSARKFIMHNIFKEYNRYIENSQLMDYKSKLQEYSQAKYQDIPSYKIINEEGPDHDKIFTVEVYLDNTLCGEGKGSNKKSAQQQAARNALKTIALD